MHDIEFHDGFPGPGKEECIQCAEGHLQQEWRCVQTCAPGYYSGEAAGAPHKMCHRCVIQSDRYPWFNPALHENVFPHNNSAASKY